jgi:hypothetical protein
VPVGTAKVQLCQCSVKPLKPRGYCTHRHVKHSAIVRSAHTVCLCVLCGSQNKQRLFPYTALTDWFLQPRRSVFTARYEMYLYVRVRLTLDFKHDYVSRICSEQAAAFQFRTILTYKQLDHTHTHTHTQSWPARLKRFGWVRDKHKLLAREVPHILNLST